MDVERPLAEDAIALLVLISLSSDNWRAMKSFHSPSAKPEKRRMSLGRKRDQRVYFGVRTCEIFLCFGAFVFLLYIVSRFSVVLVVLCFKSMVRNTGSHQGVKDFFNSIPIKPISFSYRYDDNLVHTLLSCNVRD